MIVSVRVTAKVTICVGDFTSDGHALSCHSLSHQQIHVALFCQPARFFQVGNHRLHLREWHIVQSIPISELESTKSQRSDGAE
jgi:hypothetical protein